MTPRTTRFLRGGLLLGLAAMAGLVAWSLRQRPRDREGPAASTSSAPGTGTRIAGYLHRALRGTQQSLLVKARSYTGQEQDELRLEGVDFEFSYMSKGEPKKGTIVADECLYTPTIQKGVFKGHVVVNTAEGLELRTESLVYRGDKNLARTDAPVEFKRKDMSGRSTGLVYSAEQGDVELPADVVINVADPDKPPMQIKSARAVISREEGVMKFLDGVEITQGGDRLKSGKYFVNFGEDDESIHRAQALDGVELWMSASSSMPGVSAAGAGQGTRYLKARRLDMWFRGGRTLQEAAAGPEADLTLMPGKGEPPEKRRLQARFLIFVFDDQGRLEELRGDKDAVFTAEPIPPAPGTPRKVTCEKLVARVDPATGEASFIEFLKDVQFEQGTQKASTQKAYFDGPTSTLSMKQNPELIDSAQGSNLKAQEIDIGTRSGDLAGRQNVRHVLQQRPGTRAGLLGGEGEPTVLTSRFFEYNAKDHLALYRKQALLRAGKDEVRGEEIRLHQLGDGKRKLEASGGVASRMSPRGDDKGKTPAVVEARARSMVYDEAQNRIDYEGEVVIRQGDIQTKSPKATLNLTPDGSGLQALVAGEPVEVQQGTRRATGTRATYTPSSETMVLVGEKVVLKDPTQEVEGRSLTFHVGDDRVLLDGREEIRIQMIIKQDTPRK